MGTQVPGMDDVSDTGSSNLGPGAAGGIGVLLGNSILGPSAGPIAGGVLAGATQTEQNKADTLALTGIMLGFNNMSVNQSRSTNSSRGTM